MLLVVDTNVLISALLVPGSVPERALDTALERGARVAYDARIEAEYREVLGRPKFSSIDPDAARRLLARLLSAAPEVAVPAHPGELRDESDRPFLEVAIHAGAGALITGNVRDFPGDCGVAIWTPRGLLSHLEG